MLRVDGAQLFTLEFSDGADVAVMLHGGPGASHDYLRPGLDAVAGPEHGWGSVRSGDPSARRDGKRRLFYYDQRGSGRSPLDAGVAPAGWQTHVADLDAVRVHLGGAPMTLVGYSWGALLAMLYALEHPEGVARLALISPAPAASAERAASRRRFIEMSQRPSVQALRARLDLADRKNRFALAVAGYFVDPALALDLTPFVVKQSAEEAVWRSLGEYDLRPRLRQLRVPALVAHGEDDPIPIATARATADALGAEFVAIPRCGHVPYVEGRETLFPPLLRFVD